MEMFSLKSIVTNSIDDKGIQRVSHSSTGIGGTWQVGYWTLTELSLDNELKYFWIYYGASLIALLLHHYTHAQELSIQEYYIYRASVFILTLERKYCTKA